VDQKGSDNIWIAVIGPDTPPMGERTNIAPVVQAQIAGHDGRAARQGLPSRGCSRPAPADRRGFGALVGVFAGALRLATRWAASRRRDAYCLVSENVIRKPDPLLIEPTTLSPRVHVGAGKNQLAGGVREREVQGWADRTTCR